MSAATLNWDLDVPATVPTGSALGVSEAGQIKEKPGRLWDIVCLAAGSITLLDGTAGSAAALLPPLQMAAGQVVSLQGFPFFSGLYVSAVTGEFNLSF